MKTNTMPPTVKLNTGREIPQVGLGLWLNKDEQQCKDSVAAALKAGYRHFDTAQIYKNEQFLGAALAESSVNRSELFITTKIWNDNFWWDDLLLSLDESLEKLRTDYVDLLLLHFPVTETRGPAWRRMEEACNADKAKAIGVSNYTVKHLEELLRECSVKPAVNQVELHVFLQQPELIEYCQSNGIVVEAYSPLAHGHGLDDESLLAIAKKHGKTTAQIMLHWCIEQGLVVLPKSTHEKRIKENIELFDFKLDNEDLDRIKKLNKNFRTCWDPTNVP